MHSVLNSSTLHRYKKKSIRKNLTKKIISCLPEQQKRQLQMKLENSGGKYYEIAVKHRGQIYKTCHTTTQ